MTALNNKIIIVTGGCGLIGKKIIEDILLNGGIAINFDNKVKTNKTFTKINCDITSNLSIVKAINLVKKKYKKIDGLVNNAYPRTEDWGTKFENIKYVSWKKNIEMQLNSTFYICQIVLKIMKIQKYGSIVNIGSIYGSIGPDFKIYENTKMTLPAAYAAIKGGIINFTKYLASYYGINNIRINSISPGGIFNNQDKLFVQKYISKVPLNRMGIPEDISPLICFLLSDSSLYITGQNINIDGGFSSI